jgi:hypothetical protein
MLREMRLWVKKAEMRRGRIMYIRFFGRNCIGERKFTSTLHVSPTMCGKRIVTP